MRARLSDQVPIPDTNATGEIAGSCGLDALHYLKMDPSIHRLDRIRRYDIRRWMAEWDRQPAKCSRGPVFHKLLRYRTGLSLSELFGFHALTAKASRTWAASKFSKNQPPNYYCVLITWEARRTRVGMTAGHTEPPTPPLARADQRGIGTGVRSRVKQWRWKLPACQILRFARLQEDQLAVAKAGLDGTPRAL